MGQFAALCRNNFDSHQKNTSAGGSFGLGKAALWIASRVSTVLFSSSVQKNELPEGKSNPRIFGRTELVWHQHDQADYSGPGWFGVPNQTADQVVSTWSNPGWLHALMSGGSVRFIKKTLVPRPSDWISAAPAGALKLADGSWGKLPKPGVGQALSTRSGAESPE